MSELFPNAPLREVTFQVRFPGELAIEAKRHEFHHKIRSNYPKLYVPKAQPDVAPALQAYTFKNEEETTSIGLAVNTFFLTTLRYLGFEKFKAEFLSVFSLFQEMFNIQKFSRTGLRYVNHVPALKEQGIIPLKDILKIKIQSPIPISDAYEEFLLVFAARLGEGKLRCITQYQSEQPQGREFILLDFDYFIEGELEPKRINELLEISHSHTKEVFLSLLTEDYLSVMRGETQ